MTTGGGTIDTQGSGGQPTEQAVVRIDRDTLPVWETEALPEWVVNWLIPMLSAGQKWPAASESGLSALAQAYENLAKGVAGYDAPAGTAARTIAAGMSAPATANFITRARLLYGHESGLAGVRGNAGSYSSQVSNFAVETQYSKISINVAFWITVIAIAIALYVAFFTAGSATPLIGPYAAAGRAAISRLLARLAAAGGRPAVASHLTRVAAMTGPTGPAALTRLIASPIGRELVEEIGEEGAIDGISQYLQMNKGTRTEWDWNKTSAAAVGAGTGAVVGMRLAGPVSSVTRHVPGFTGRALSTGLNNAIASPVGSFVANGVVYDQWQNPFTADSMTGGFLGGVGRTGSISPFNPDVLSALTHPTSALASAYDAAAQADAARTAAGPPPAGGPTPDSSSPSGPPSTTGPTPSAPTPSAPTPGTSTPGASTPQGAGTTAATRTSGPGAPDTADQGTRASSAADQQSRQPGDASGGRTATRQAPTADDSTTPPGDRDEDRTPTTAPTPDSAPDPQRSPRTTAADGPTPEQTQAADLAQPSADERSGDVQSADQRSGDQRSAEAQSTDAQATDPQSADTQSSDPQSADQESADSRSGDQTAGDQGPSAAGQAAAEPGPVQGDPATDPGADTSERRPAATATSLADNAPPHAVRAHTALVEALGTSFPNMTANRDGDLVVPRNGGDLVVSAATVRGIQATLNRSAENVTDLSRLRAEATLLLVQAVGRVVKGQSAPDGDQDTSRPGTVTSRPLRGTRFVTGGRPPGTTLTPDEIRAGITTLKAGDFLQENVRSLTWSSDGSTLRVQIGADNVQYFRPVVGRLARTLMAKTDIRAGTTEDTAHVVRFAPGMAADQVARVWLHEITDTLQRQASPRKRRTLRRLLTDWRRRGTQDECLPARLNEHAFLSEQWKQATTLPEKRLLAVDIDGVARDIALRGHPEPSPPWAPPQAERPPHAPPLTDGIPSRLQMEEAVDAFTGTEERLRKEIATLEQRAEEAAATAQQFSKGARRAYRQRDAGRYERARTARKEVRRQQATQKRHERIADAYRTALGQAEEARKSYEEALRPGATQLQLALRARVEHQLFLHLLSKALPDEASLSDAMPAGRFAHLTRLTDTVNELLRDNGIDHRYTTDGLQKAMRQDFQRIISPEGGVLRVGSSRSAAELRIRLTVGDLVEVLDLETEASEMMVGLFALGGRTVGATKTGSVGLAPPINTAALAAHLPEDHPARMILEMVNVRISPNVSRGASMTGAAASFAQMGAVVDNRSGSSVVDGSAAYKVQIRTSYKEGWKGTVTVDSGEPGDSASQRMWVSHPYLDPPARDVITIDADKRDPAMPNVTPSGMTGLEEALDAAMKELGGEYARIGSVAHHQLRTIITEELQVKLRQAVNTGYQGVITVNGRQDATVEVKSELVEVPRSKMVGGASDAVWEEEVLVDFAAVNGNASYTRSRGITGSVGPAIPDLTDVELPGSDGEYAPTFGPRGNLGRGVARSDSSTANAQAIYPNVLRKTGHRQGYEVRLVHTITVRKTGKPPVTLAPVHGTALVSMLESAAFRLGLPVSREALVYRFGKVVRGPDGVPRLRGTVGPRWPKGRRAAPPDWLGDGPGQMRGAGPAMVESITNLDDAAKKVLKKLGELGIVPKIDGEVLTYANNKHTYSSNDIESVSQALNLIEVVEQLTEQRILAAYDTVAQDGIYVDLVHHQLNHAPELYTLHIQLKQNFDTIGNIRVVDSEAQVGLPIGSDTRGQATSWSRTYSAGVSLGMGDSPGPGQDGQKHDIGANLGVGSTETIGSSTGNTGNVVGLGETAGLVAKMDVEHKLIFDLLHQGERTELSVSGGQVTLGFSADLLPAEHPQNASVGSLPDMVANQATLLHMDTPDMLAAAERVLPRTMGSEQDQDAAGEDSQEGEQEDLKEGEQAPFHHWANFVSSRSLVAHAGEWREGRYQDELGVQPQKGGTQSSLSVTGAFGEAEVIGAVHYVSGRIKFGLTSAGISWGGSSNTSAGASVGAAGVNDGGTTNDGGKIDLPSRTSGTGASRSQLDIAGNEDLSIGTGIHYFLTAKVNFQLTGSESVAVPGTAAGRTPAGETLHTTSQGMSLMSIPEYDALQLYAQGEFALPLHLVADAVERFANGSLSLDTMLATPLIQRYLKEVAKARAAGQDVGLADRHTPRTLLRAVRQIADLGKPDRTRREPVERLNRALSRAAELNERASDVVLAPSLVNSMGTSTVESFVLTDEQGDEVTLLDAVLDAVAQDDSEAPVHDPTFLKQLSVDFAGDRSHIHVGDMWSRRGLERSYKVLTSEETGQTEKVTVRVRLVPLKDVAPDRAKLIGRTGDAGIIKQRYVYYDLTETESYNGSYAVGVSGNTEDNGDASGLSVGTDRTRSFSGSRNQQDVTLQRVALFRGIEQVEQVMVPVIEVERPHPRTGKVTVRNATTDKPELRATLVRRIPAGMSRPAHLGPITPSSVNDPRRAEVHAGHFVESLFFDRDKPTLYEVVSGQLTKMLGPKTMAEKGAEVVARLSDSSLLARFDRMASPGGAVMVPVAVPGVRDQGLNVSVEAHLSDLEVVGGPYQAEKGEIDRRADNRSVSVSRGRLGPLTVGMNGADNASGVGVGMSIGEQASESMSDSGGSRKERTKNEKSAKTYTVRFRVDYDVTYQRMARRPGRLERAVGDPLFRGNAASGEVYLTLFEDELAELRERMEHGVRLGAARPVTATFTTTSTRTGLIQRLTDARLEARERGEAASVAVWEPDGVHRFSAFPDGTVHSETADGGFAEAFSTLAPEVLAIAEEEDLDLRLIFMTSEVPGTFTQQVLEELRTRNVAAAEAPKGEWPYAQGTPHPTAGTSAGQGVSVGAMASNSSALPGTPYDVPGRPEQAAKLSMAEVLGQDLTAADFGGAGITAAWAGDRRTLLMRSPTMPVAHVKVLLTDPGEGLMGRSHQRAGTADDPHIMVLSPDLPPLLVSSVMVHEITHLGQEQAAATAGRPQGMVRTALPSAATEGTDNCLLPRFNEHAHLSRKWQAATDPAVRRYLAAAIDAIAADITRRGHTPPASPQDLGRVAPPKPRNRIEALINWGTPSAPGSSPPVGAPGSPAFGGSSAVPMSAAELPVTAAMHAIERGALLAGAQVRRPGPGLLDLVVPGHPPIPVEVRSPQGHAGPPALVDGVLVFQIAPHATIGATERAAAAAAADAVSRALGTSQPDLPAVAALAEAVRQVRTATPTQRPARVTSLLDLAVRPDIVHLLTPELAGELTAELQHAKSRLTYEHRQLLRLLTNGTGWHLPEECPEDGPCLCGRRTEHSAARA
ncbi:hypothetical protein ACTMTF_19065 [Nonomuraea sp. ZG12]|uniref:WXG100-like domain-containing protein n=1 Tax=Nonomuraea sp. ZG12 TaxID=3452207 RepID=UPI003F8AEF8D